MENLRGFQRWHVERMENILNADNFHENSFVLQPMVPGILAVMYKDSTLYSVWVGARSWGQKLQ